MGIRYDNDRAVLEGIAGVEDAEGLMNWLRDQPQGVVEMAGCEHLHAAVLQVLLALKPRLEGTSPQRWLAQVLPS